MEKTNPSPHLVVPKRRRVIKESEFATREDLLSVEMPDSVSVIKEGAFWAAGTSKA